MNRTLGVVRMQLVNKATFVWVPLIILGGAFVISVGIWGILSANGVTINMYGGGAQAPMWYFVAVGVQAMTLSFPFSQAMSVTRREFFLGTWLTAAITGGILAAIFIVGGFIETATSGWGVNGYFFALDWLWTAGPLAAGLFYFFLTMAVFGVGFASAAIYKRWGSIALTTVYIALALVLLVAVWAISVSRSWGQVAGAIVEAGVWGLITGLAALALVFAGFSAAVMRRITT